MDDFRRAEDRIRYCHKVCAPPSGSAARRKAKFSSIRRARRVLKHQLRKEIDRDLR